MTAIIPCKCGGFTTYLLDWYPGIVDDETGEVSTGKMYKVKCFRCKKTVFGGTKEKAIARWNEAMK